MSAATCAFLGSPCPSLSRYSAACLLDVVACLRRVAVGVQQRVGGLDFYRRCAQSVRKHVMHVASDAVVFGVPIGPNLRTNGPFCLVKRRPMKQVSAAVGGPCPPK